MLTKTRTIVITLIAAGSFAAATVAPAVSQAQDNSSNSLSASMCQSSKDMAQHDIEEAAEAVGRGDYEAAALWSESASEDAREAEKWCAEAAAGGHAPTKVVVAPRGAISTAPVTTVFHPKRATTSTSTTTVRFG